MTLSIRLRRMVVAASTLGIVTMAYPAAAQEVSESHLRAARAAISALGATRPFDMILPQAAMQMKNELIQNNPDLVSLINRTVDEQAIALAPRRADLEREAALTYARAFSEEELNAMAEFYGSDVGRKFLELGPNVASEVYRAAEIWQNGIGRDLVQNVSTALQEEAGRQVDTGIELDMESLEQ